MSFDHAKPAIHAQNLGKQYVLGASPYQRLWQLLVGSSSNLSHFNALSGVDINIAQGESVGIIGQNGAGKSTLLQILATKIFPTQGVVRVLDKQMGMVDLFELRTRIGLCGSVIAEDIPYIGMIGSKRKIKLMREDFLQRSWATAAQFDRVHAPVGLDIHSRSVQEIAVSIAAQLVQVRNRTTDT